MLSSNQVQPESPAVQSYLGILQSIITRMANNSSNCKTWCITIVSAILVVIVDKNQPSYVWIAIFPIVLFFFLDAYYLAQERGFRDIYTHFVHKLHSDSATSQDLFVIKAPKGWPLCKTIFASAFSAAIAPFYGILTFTAFLANSFIVKP